MAQPNKHHISTQILLIVGFACITVSVALIVIPYEIYPQLYISKSNPSFGYTVSNTLEGWLFLITALILLALGIILIIISALRQQKEFRLPHINMGPR